MNILELGAIGELVGGVAVIGSLLLITDLLPWYRWTEGSG